MLADSTVFATVAVSDIAAGKAFYGETLGLAQVDENPGGVMYQSGGGKIFVYQSTTAGKGEATCAAWSVNDVAACVSELKAKGVVFETYDVPGATWNGEVADFGSMQAAWFKDPDGNILSVGS